MHMHFNQIPLFTVCFVNIDSPISCDWNNVLHVRPGMLLFVNKNRHVTQMHPSISCACAFDAFATPNYYLTVGWKKRLYRCQMGLGGWSDIFFLCWNLWIMNFRHYSRNLLIFPHHIIDTALTISYQSSMEIIQINKCS